MSERNKDFFSEPSHLEKHRNFFYINMRSETNFSIFGMKEKGISFIKIFHFEKKLFGKSVILFGIQIKLLCVFAYNMRVKGILALSYPLVCPSVHMVILFNHRVNLEET